MLLIEISPRGEVIAPFKALLLNLPAVKPVVLIALLDKIHKTLMKFFSGAISLQCLDLIVVVPFQADMLCVKWKLRP